MAFRNTDVSGRLPFRYIIVVFAIILGYVSSMNYLTFSP